MANDIRINTVVSALPTTSDLDSNGVISFYCDLGGATPKLAIFFGSGGQANDTEAAGLQFFVGATDGTNQWVSSFNSNSATATTRVGSHASATSCILKTSAATGASAGATQWEAAFSAWVPDGVTLDFSTSQASGASRFSMILIGGADFSCKVGVVNAPTLDTEVLTTVGFQLSALICSYIYEAFDGAGDLAVCLGSLGIASYDGSTIIQRAKLHSSRSGVTTVESGGALLNARIAGALNVTGTTLHHGHELTTVSATQFGLTPRTADPVDARADVGYVAMKFGSLATKVQSISFPTTAAADWTVSGVGFAPKMALMLGSTLTAENSVVGTGAGSVHAVGCAVAGEAGWSFAVRDDDADTDTNPHANSLSNNARIKFLTDSGGDAISIVSSGLYTSGFNADGFTIPLANLTSVIAGPVLGAALFISNHAPVFETAMSFVGGQSHVRVSGTFDQDCTLYIQRVADGAAAPTAADLVTTHDYAVTTTQSFPWTKGWITLPVSTNYDVYATGQNASGQLTTATKIDVATTAVQSNVQSRTVTLT